MYPRASVDIDGVLSRFVESFIRKANELRPGIFPPNYVHRVWHFEDSGIPGVDKKFVNSVWEVIKADPFFWANEEPYEENVRALRGFIWDERVEVFYITARMATGGVSALEQTIRWLGGQALMNARTSVIPVSGPEAKKSLMELLQIQDSLDDYAPTVRGCDTIIGHRAYLLKQPWNQAERESEALLVVDSVEEYLNKVMEDR